MLITTGVSAFRHSYLTSRKYLYIFMLINISVCYCICVKLAMNLHVSNSNPLPHWSLQPPPLICNLPLQWTTWFPESSICLLHGSYLVYMYTMSEVFTWSPIVHFSIVLVCECVCLKTPLFSWKLQLCTFSFHFFCILIIQFDFCNIQFDRK